MNPNLFIKRNASTILTVLGCVGTVATAIYSARATPKAIRLLKEAEAKKGEQLTICEKVKTVNMTYAPAVILGITTMGCIISANVLMQHHQKNLISAYAMLNQGYQSYRCKVRELYGEEADQKIIEAIAVENGENIYIQASYLGSNCDISVDESVGRPILFYEEYSKRFFSATVEQVQRAEYHLNRNYILRGDTNLNEFYSLLGLKETEEGEVCGWAPYDEGEFWIEFSHKKSKLKDGTEFYIIEFPFPPRLGYWEEPDYDD